MKGRGPSRRDWRERARAVQAYEEGWALYHRAERNRDKNAAALERGHHSFRTALEVFEKVQDSYRALKAYRGLGLISQALGRDEEAYDCAQRCVERCKAYLRMQAGTRARVRGVQEYHAKALRELIE